jgi:hypothetical protein
MQGRHVMKLSSVSSKTERWVKVLSNMAIDVEDNYDGLEMCGECRMEGTTKRNRMMIRSRQSDNAMAGNVDIENFHSQRVERQQAVRSGRGGYRWEGGCEEITASRGATLCDAWCVRKWLRAPTLLSTT